MKEGVAFADAAAAPRGPAERTDHGAVPPPNIDAFTAFIAETLVPALRGRGGYRSLEVVVDRVSGDVQSSRPGRTRRRDAPLPTRS
jgi:hypothetical protein